MAAPIGIRIYGASDHASNGSSRRIQPSQKCIVRPYHHLASTGPVWDGEGHLHQSHRMPRHHLLLVAASTLMLGGCATLVKGSSQAITITSNVDGAEILLDGQLVGSTPFSGVVPKGKTTVMLRKAGYACASVTLSKTLEPIFWGNIISGGTTGSLTDFATGAAYAYAPATYQVDLKAASESDAAFADDVTLRGLAMVYMDDIVLELARGGGEHVVALSRLLQSRTGKPTAPAVLSRAVATSEGDAVRFGREVLRLAYGEKSVK